MPRVVHEDDRSYRLDNGAVIAKAALSDAMHARIKGYAVGGVVDDGLSEADRAAAAQAAGEAWALQMRRASGSGEPTDAPPAVEVPPPAPVDPGSFQQMLGNPANSVVDTGPADRLAAVEGLATVPANDMADALLDPTRTSTTTTMTPLGVSDAMLRGGGGTVAPGMAPAADLAPLNVEGIIPKVDLRAGNNDRGTLFDAAQPNGPGPGGLLALTAPFAGFANGQHPPPSAPTLSGESAPIPVAPASVAASAGQRSTSPRPSVEQPYREDPALAQALRAQQVASDGAAAIEKARLANAAQQELDNAKALEDRRADYERQRDEIQGRAENLANDVASGRLDPNRLWSKLDTGQRLGNAISLILGGIGSALAGGPNQALQVIEGAIDRDIESQKDERSRKEGLLQFHIQQGRDLTQAYTLAKADMLDIAAGKMRGAASRYGSMATAANALAASGALAQKAIELRTQGLERDLDGKFKRAQIARLQAESAEAYAKIRTMKGAAAGASNVAALKNALVAGAKVDPRLIEALLPEADRNRVVQTAPGVYALAVDKDGADKVKAATESRNTLHAQISQLKEIRARNPHGWIPVGGALADTADRGRAEALQSAIKIKLKDLAALGALSGSDVNLLEDQVPDITSLTPTSNADARIEQLSKSTDAVLRAVQNAHLMRQEQPAIQFATR